jgi:hypothetical protein
MGTSRLFVLLSDNVQLPLLSSCQQVLCSVPRLLAVARCASQSCVTAQHGSGSQFIDHICALLEAPCHSFLCSFAAAAAAVVVVSLQAVRKMMDAKKLESTLNYDSSFGDGNQKG